MWARRLGHANLRAWRRRLARAVAVLVAFGVLTIAAHGARATEVSAATLTIEDGFLSQVLGKHLLLAIDTSGQRSVDDLQQALARGDGAGLAFKRSAKDVPNLSYIDGAVWAVTHVVDARATSSPLVLEVDYPPLDFVEAFVIADGVVVVHESAGDHVPRALWPRPTTTATFELPALRSYDLWLRVRGESALQIPATLRTTRTQVHEEQTRIAAQALYFGALLAMALYNLLVWSSIRSRAYLYYVGFLTSYGIMQLGLNGVGNAVVWGDLQPFGDMIVPRFIAIQGCMALLFVRELLAFVRTSRWATRAAKGIGAVGCALLLASFVLRYAPIMRMTLGLIISWAVYMIAVGVEGARRGERVARFYLMAWGAFAAGAACIALVNLNVMPSTRITRNITMIGSAIEFLLLSFALADRMKQLQAEATANAELAAQNARLAQEASERALAEQERANAELVRLDKVKDEFLANTSHELRTPIHGVTGILDALLARPSLGEADRQDVNHALGAAQRLGSLVSAVLDFSMFRAGRMRIETRPVDLASIVEAAALRLRGDAKVPLRIGVIDRSLAANGDAERLRQLVAQLVGNAVKFTSTGSIDVSLRVDGMHVVFEVRDTGVGIPPERLSQVFAGLEQGDGSATREAGGLGIGLALAKRIAEAHDGELVLRSQPGEGTTVRVRLPATAEPVADASASVVEAVAARTSEVRATVLDDAAMQRMTSTIPQRPSSLRPSLPPPRRAYGNPLQASLKAAALPAMAVSTVVHDEAPVSEGAPLSLSGVSSLTGDAGVRILVADDDPMNRRVLRLQLAPLGFDLVEAEDGADALEKYATAGPFDAILLDVMMPKASGYEVCRKIRETHGATELPILMLTAKAQVRDLLEGFEAGANDYVPKPFSKAELLARIRTHVTMARTHQALRRFVPQGALEILGHENVVDVRLGDTTECNLAVLFSDVRGFSALSEARTPAEVFALLNECYARLGPKVRAEGGFVDKYIGDGMMALFPKGPEAAIRAAIAMQRTLEKDVAGESLRIGVGIHAGPTLLGTLGEADRFDATVISDTVNVASRIEGASKQLGAKLLVSAECLEHVQNAQEFQTRLLGRIQVKGRVGSVAIVEVLDAEEPALAQEKLASRKAFGAALEAFVEGDWALAQERFGAVVDASPEDAAAALYLAASALAEAGDLSAIGSNGSLALREK